MSEDRGEGESRVIKSKMPVFADASVGRPTGNDSAASHSESQFMKGSQEDQRRKDFHEEQPVSIHDGLLISFIRT